MQIDSWPGASLLERQQERINAARLVARLRGLGEMQWILLDGHDFAGLRALLELGAKIWAAQSLRR